MALNTASSIVDFLKSRGFQPETGERVPLFRQRKQIFESLGLGQNLGEFVGTAEQNTTLLRSLSKAETGAGVSLTPENIFTAIRVAQGGPAVAGQPPAQPQPAVPSAAPSPAVPPAPPSAAPAPFVMPPELQERVNLLTKTPTAEELAQKATEEVFGKVSFPLRQEAALAEKEQLRLKGQADTEDFIKKIASRGLIFSGAKTKGVQAIEADTLAKQLGVDRKFALLIAEGLESAAQRVAKEAQKGSQQALRSLEALGFTINPLTNRIEPTLAARKALEQEEQFTIREERLQQAAGAAEARFETTQQRLEREAAAREQRFQESQAATQARFEATQARLEAKEADFTRGEKAALTFDDIKTRAGKILLDVADKSIDKFTDPNEFMKFRDEVKKTVPSFIDDFDKAFASLLNPVDAKRLGISQEDVDPFEAAKRRAGG